MIVPTLQHGDRLTRDEFERRFDATPGLKKAELIEGVVHLPPPARFSLHGQPQFDLIAWLGTYAVSTPGVLGGNNSSLRLDPENEPQPEAILLIDPARGGQAAISADDYVEGTPELVGEIAASSASYDLHSKLNVYRRNGVRKYLVWRLLDRTVDWFVLRGGQFTPLSPDGPLLKSESFPGLWLDPAALIRGDMAAVMNVLQQGIATPEHAAFVARLGASPRKP